MKTMLTILLLAIGLVIVGQYFESKKDPYEVGMHWDYSIECENGFVYKTLSGKRGSIQIFNSDGTPLKCGHKIY